MNMYTGKFAYLIGSSYELGEQQALEYAEHAHVKEIFFTEQSVSNSTYLEKRSQFAKYCPGLNEELEGFAKGFGRDPQQLKFYNDGWLIPGGCSIGAILPRKMVDGKTYVIRNYDLSPDISDMRLCTTKVNGKYTHTGFSVSTFGRSEGLNEKGLCAAFASCGMPIGHYPGMRAPATAGLQFMVIVRAVLERCKNVEEAVYAVMNMPVGTNMNLLLADSNGDAALVGTYDGVKVVKKAEQDYLLATNHGLFSEIEALELGKLEQSQLRYDILENKCSNSGKRAVGEIKELLSTEYPKGLTVHNYNEKFGTVHSILFNVTDGQLEFSFGSPLQNTSYTLQVGEHFAKTEIPVELSNKNYGAGFWRIIR
ncbi:C45 family autoproteolytic acyltransferase/hydolase [Paenibacillus arenosi]|uniref:Choloylglycine hydrolase n=1 Tax=Paenibacillus arenosi TaxID=2774142 RepID=A0ABR9B2W9_9BACL|nr:C45 family peptidase [Paenibacillus arenosi]MBD8499777.1 choloylglycine hydrolase [Paenibacillus arenosi]